MDTSPTTLLVEHAGPVATVTLHRPDVLHALNATMFDDLAAAFAALSADSQTRVILLTGSGEKAFAAGADIRGLEELDAITGVPFSERGQRVFTAIERCPKPVIAMVNGVALGGGLELALAATIRLAATHAKLGLPEVRLGLIPGYGGTQRLARLIGRSAALRMILSASPVTAEEALRLGLIDELVPSANLHARGVELATLIASHAPLAVAAALEALPPGGDSLGGTSLNECLAREARLFGRLCGSADKNEGVAAFLGKRKAVWEGR